MGHRGDDCARADGDAKWEWAWMSSMCTEEDVGKVRRGSEQDSRRGEGHPLPCQQEPKLVTGAYSYLLIFVLFHISLPSSIDWCVVFLCAYSVVCFKLKTSRRLFIFKARITWYDFFLESVRTLSDLRTVVNSWNWNIEHLRYSCIMYVLPSSLSSWWTRCWMDGVATPPRRRPHAAVDGARNGERRSRQTWEGVVAFASGRFCVVLFLSEYFWILYCFISHRLDHKTEWSESWSTQDWMMKRMHVFLSGIYLVDHLFLHAQHRRLLTRKDTHVRTYVMSGNLWYVDCYICGIIYQVVSRWVSLGNAHCGMIIRCLIDTLPSVGANWLVDFWRFVQGMLRNISEFD